MKTIALIAALLLAFPDQPVNAQQDTIIKVATRPVHAGIAALKEEISIGELEGEEEYLFGRVSEVAVARDGSIYVFDDQVPALRKYDANGKYVRTFGRKGQGPGEYLYGGGLGVGADGKVYLWDTGTWRINVYSPAGELVNSLATPSGMGANVTFKTSRALIVGADGALYVRRSMRRSGQPASELAERDAWLKLSATGAVVDTLHIPEVGPQPPLLKAVNNTATSSAQASTGLPYAPRPLAELSPLGYFVTSFPSRYAFELPSTGKVLSIRRNVQPEPVTAAERADARKRVEENMKRTQPDWSWNGPDVPKVKSAFDVLAVAADGRIWVPLVRNTAGLGGASFSSMQSGGGGGSRPGSGVQQPQRREQRPADPPKPGLFDVFEPGGTYLGQVHVPAGVSLMYRRGDQVWGIARDEFDVARVKRYRIQWR